jgi:hypothetical protein
LWKDAFHCEDANLRSYDLTIIGVEIWIFIESSDNEKFEALVDRVCGRPCVWMECEWWTFSKRRRPK